VKTGNLGRGVSIVGAGYTPLGDVQKTPEIKGFTEREMYSYASLEAMEDAGVEAKDIEAYYVGICGPNYFAKTTSAGPHFSEWIGTRNKPSLFHDEGCATAGIGLQQAVMAVASGAYDCVLSAAVNINFTAPKVAKPPHLRGPLDSDSLAGGLYSGVDSAYEKPGGGGIGPLEAQISQYCRNYGVSFQELDDAVVAHLQVQRTEALMNPKASLITETYEEEAKRCGFNDVKEYLQSDTFNPRIGGQVRAKHMGQVRDGASAVIVCTTEKARQLTKTPIEVAGIASTTALHSDFVSVPTPADTYVFETIYAMAGVTDPYSEVEYMGIHDCPATMIPLAGESAGYLRRGEGWKSMLDGQLSFDGDRPINTGGGRTQTGHPMSPAFGIDVAEAVMQMRGEGGQRQIAKPPETSVIWGGGVGFSIAAVALKALSN
jgi:acetyl-CoA C-acetyltransferase